MRATDQEGMPLASSSVYVAQLGAGTKCSAHWQPLHSWQKTELLKADHQQQGLDFLYGLPPSNPRLSCNWVWVA